MVKIYLPDRIIIPEERFPSHLGLVTQRQFEICTRLWGMKLTSS